MIRAALLVIFAIVFMAPIMGIHEQPWSPWWFQKKDGSALPVAVDSLPAGSIDIGALPLGPAPAHSGPQPLVSDSQRFELAVEAGFTHEEAITATAISIAEDGGGDPGALGTNRDRAGNVTSYDLGLWQINSAHWAEFGGNGALVVPINNARAALVLYHRGGWTQWCTYPGGCGGLPGAPNWASDLARARAVAR